MRYAWLSAWWGSLPLEGGIEAAYRAEIEAAADPKAKLAEIEARLNALRSPFRTAETFAVEEIIDPRDTRRLLCDFANLAEPLRLNITEHGRVLQRKVLYDQELIDHAHRIALHTHAQSVH